MVFHFALGKRQTKGFHDTPLITLIWVLLLVICCATSGCGAFDSEYNHIVADEDAELMRILQSGDIGLTSGSLILDAEPGGRDPEYQYFRWTIFTTGTIQIPKLLEPECLLDLKESVKLVEGPILQIAKPKSAVSFFGIIMIFNIQVPSYGQEKEIL